MADADVGLYVDPDMPEDHIDDELDYPGELEDEDLDDEE